MRRCYKIPVRDTSVETYRELRDEGELGDRQFKVLKWLTEYIEDRQEDEDVEEELPTARELHDWLAVDRAIEEAQLGGPNFVKPRITELKELGYVEEKGKKTCSVTERKAYKLDVKTPPQKNIEENDVYVDDEGNKYIFPPDEDDPSEDQEPDELEQDPELDEDEEESETEVRQEILFKDGEVVS